MRPRVGPLSAILAILSAVVAFLTAPADAQPTVDEIVPPLPAVIPTPSNWEPKFPFPYDQTRAKVTDADINAEREMCQWYNAQYDTLMDQIDNFNVNITRNNGDYNVANNPQLTDAIIANLDQAVNFLAPRAQALTVIPDFAGDMYFPIYQGESFYRLWQQLSNVSGGIRGRQPVWFYGPSLQHALRWGSRINRSHVCD
jgi:hypothetical protein